MSTTGSLWYAPDDRIDCYEAGLVGLPLEYSLSVEGGGKGQGHDLSIGRAGRVVENPGKDKMWHIKVKQ